MLQKAWLTLTPPERLEHFHRLIWAETEAFFLGLRALEPAEVIRCLPCPEQRLSPRLLAPDDTADVIQEAPLIISSGGSAGSQAATLMVRALALDEVRLRDWWRVCRRECTTAAAMGAVLGAVGFFRILLWQGFFHAYGVHYMRLGLSVAVSLIGVVLWGTLTGSMLPLVLQWLGCDPASASTRFVATLVDVTELVIYFSVATVMLQGALL
jgi:hypothetical protein